MTDDDPDTDAQERTTDRGGASTTESDGATLRAEAKWYAETAADRPDRVRGAVDRVVDLLRTEAAAEATEATLERRAAASAALVRVTADDADATAEYAGELVDVVADLRRVRARERDREHPSGTRVDELRREVTDNLVRTVALVVADRPEAVAAVDLSGYAGAVTADLDADTLRTVAKALFAAAPELQRPAPAVAILRDLVASPDAAVRAWGAGALGRLAETFPDAAAAAVDDLRPLLDHDDETVRHNAVEALAALVSERPDAVAPVAADLRALLDDAVAIQHNAAGVLGRLAETHPDAVVPAAADLRALCDHDDEAVRRVATAALARLARERPDAIPGE